VFTRSPTSPGLTRLRSVRLRIKSVVLTPNKPFQSYRCHIGSYNWKKALLLLSQGDKEVSVRFRPQVFILIMLKQTLTNNGFCICLVRYNELRPIHFYVGYLLFLALTRHTTTEMHNMKLQTYSKVFFKFWTLQQVEYLLVLHHCNLWLKVDIIRFLQLTIARQQFEKPNKSTTLS